MNIIELAKQANGEPAWTGGVDWTWEELAKFAALVEEAARVDEREQCAKIARDIGNATEPDDWALDKCQEIEAAIRARGTT